jgi:hypothetical protein
VYNDITDNSGKVVKTAGEVQAAVSDLLRQIGTSREFADRIAAEYAAPGKTGNDLYARLLQEAASLASAVPAAGPKPTKAVMDAAAQVADEEAHLFSMRDGTKPGIDIMAEVKGGELEFMVRAVLKGTGERGTLGGSYMFERTLAHFASEKTAIDVIVPMKGVSESLVEELRHNASQGASVPELLRLLHGRLGHEATYGTTLAKYFMAAFELPLRTVSPIGGWAPDSTGEISDVRIQELIYPEIMQKKRLWENEKGNEKDEKGSG